VSIEWYAYLLALVDNKQLNDALKWMFYIGDVSHVLHHDIFADLAIGKCLLNTNSY